jgi:putative DNA primase/helicase
MFMAWKFWAGDNGHKAGTAQHFGRNLHAVIPGLWVVRTRDGDDRERVYRGVILGKTAGGE